MIAPRLRRIAHSTCRTGLACLVGLVCLAGGTGPAQARIRVETSHTPGFDLGSYETFAWEEEPVRPETDPRAPGGELDQVYKEVVGARLAKAGLRQVGPEAAPDLRVRWTVYAEDVLASEETWNQYEHWAVSVDPVGLSGTRGIVIVELIDGAADAVVWTGKARASANSPQELRKKARKMLEKLVAPLR